MLNKQAIEQERENIKYSLAQYIPYLDFHKNFIFMEDQADAVVLRIEAVYDDILSNQELHQMEDGLINFLNSFDQNVYVQFLYRKHQHFDDLKKAHLEQDESKNQLVHNIFDKRIKKLEQEIKDKEIFNYSIYIILKKQFGIKINDVKKVVLSPDKIGDEIVEIYNARIKKLYELMNKYKGYLEKSMITVHIPSEQEVIDLVASCINLTEMRNVKFDGKYDLMHSDLKKYPSYLFINDKYCRVITFKNDNLPEESWMTLIKHICKSNLRFNYDISISLQILPKEKEIKSLQRLKVFTRGLKYKLASNDIDEEKQLKENNISELLTDMVSGRENLFNFEFAVIVKGDTVSELKKNCEDMLSSIKLMGGAEGFKESFANFLIWLNTLPGNATLSNYRTIKYKTSYFAGLLPIFGPPEGKDEPMIIFRNLFKSITYYNPFSPKFINKNGIVIGTTGSGKSFLMNCINLSYLSKDPIILIVDKGGSYKKFIQTLGGDYFEVSLENSINPFDVAAKNKELFWKAIIEVMIKEEKQPITNDEKIVIEEAIARVVNKNIEKPMVSDFVKAIDEIKFQYEDLVKVKNKISRHLQRWTRGQLGSFVNNKNTSLNTESDIIGFDLKGLEDYPELLEIFMFYITNICWYKAELDRKRKKVFVFDEAWHMFLSEQGSRLLMELYRTLRKYGGSIFSVSQDVSDFADSKYSSSIMQNISFFYILEQAPGTDYQKLQKSLNLRDTEINEITNIKSAKGKYSEMFVKTPAMSFVGQMVPSPYEYWVATTDNDDIAFYNQMLKEYNNDILKTLNFLAEKYPYGAF